LQIAVLGHAASKNVVGGFASADSFAGGTEVGFLHFAATRFVVSFKLNWIYGRAINSDPAHFGAGGTTAEQYAEYQVRITCPRRAMMPYPPKVTLHDTEPSTNPT
jgi:hypothetical protein